MANSTTGYPGKGTGIGGTSLERVQFEADTSASEAVTDHEDAADPHDQYTTEDDIDAASLVITKRLPAGIMPLALDGEPGEQGIPGPPGPRGATGATGPPGTGGSGGAPVLWFEGNELEEAIAIPGPAGPAGATGGAGTPGAPGVAGPAGVVGPPGWDAEAPEEPLLIPGPAGATGPQGAPGGGGGNTLELVKPMTGTATVATGKWVLAAERWQLTSTQRLTIAGTGRLRINN
jgi:hypothetical protein